MKWNIRYYNEAVEGEVLSLPDSLLARYARLTEVMKDYGPNLGMPHTKAMGDGLFELRLKGKEGIARVFYCTIINHEIIILHTIIKKQQKTPLQELRLAKERLKEVKRDGKKIT
jgi:phage-related protein